MVNQIQSLQIRQSQTLVMTQAMQQSLKILQLSSLELADFIETELQKNPLLETEGEQTEKEPNYEASSEGEETSEAKTESDSFDKLNDSGTDNEALDGDMNDSWSSGEDNGGDNNFDTANFEDQRENYSNNNSAEDDAGTIIEKTYTKELSLKEHLLEQINLDIEDPKEKMIAAHIVDMVDASGYLSSPGLDDDLKNLATQLGCEKADIDKAIKRLQQCDPTGVCSRNLKECLKIQLRENDHLDPAMEKLVDNLELLAKGEIEKLRKLCGVDGDDLKDMVFEIKALNPRPASGFMEDRPQTKIADLILEKKSGKWMLELNSEILPKINVRKDYYNQIKQNKLKQSEKKYLSENFNSANFLMRAISQRAETMLKVGSAILKKQEQFLDKGINYLKPISMKDIAEEVGLHESTIGRVVANKYIATPRGVYELRYFFSNSLASTYSNEEFSTVTARHQIKEIIENEAKVLSDDDIAKILKGRGIDIARRTVAKYREAMAIPTSAERKRLKKISI